MKAFHEVRNYDDDFMVWHSSYSNISYMAHWHKETEFMYVRSGSIPVTITNQTFLAREGDFVFCDSGEIHYSPTTSLENSVDFIVFDCNILKPHYQTSSFLSPLITREMQAECRIEKECHGMINTVIRELNNRAPCYEGIVEDTLHTFWLLLKRHIPRNNNDLLSKDRHLHALDSFQQLLSYLDEHYQESVPLEYAAEFMHFSTGHFSKVFKRLMGLPYVSYLNLLRIEHACSQLSGTSTILDTALNCGFNNIRTFNRTFKQFTGLTPSEFLNLPDASHYNISYPGLKDPSAQIVENDSTMLIHYHKNGSELLECED